MKLFRAAAFASLIVIPLINAVATDEKALILQTEPEETIIPLQGNLSIRADGNILATPLDPTVCGGGVVSCEGVEVTIGSFSANNVVGTAEGSSSPGSVSISQQDPLTMRWDSLGARSCTASGTLPPWTATQTRPVVSPAAGIGLNVSDVEPGIYIAELQCQNGGVSSQRFGIQVAIEEAPEDPPPGTQCGTSRRLPSSWTQRVTGCASLQGGFPISGASDCSTYASVFGSSLQNAAGMTRNVGMGGNQYVAMEINTDNLSATRTGRISVEFAQPAMPSGNYMITISSCPGDFNQTEVMADTGCYFHNPSNVNWGGSQTSENCKLTPGQTYYLNFIFTSSPVGTSPANLQPVSSCEGTTCGKQFAPQVFAQ